MGASFSIGRTTSLKKKNPVVVEQQVPRIPDPITWNGQYDEIHRKHDYGIEYDTRHDTTAYGLYQYGTRVGTWEFKQGSVLKSIHEYKNGVLIKVTQFENGVSKEIYLHQTEAKKSADPLPDTPKSDSPLPDKPKSEVVNS